MRPLTVITGIILGSAFSIALGLSVVLLIFAIIGADYPQIDAERGGLVEAIALFSVLTAFAAVSFVGQLRERWWQYPGLVVMWGALLLIGMYYWPEG